MVGVVVATGVVVMAGVAGMVGGRMVEGGMVGAGGTAGVRGPDAGCGMSLLCGLWFSTPEVFWFVLFTCLGDNATIGPGAMVGRSCLPRTSMSLYMN